MSFVLGGKETFWWPVTVKIPVDGGKHESHTFQAEFKRLTQSQLLELAQDGSTTKTFSEAVLVGWKDVVDNDQKEVPFSTTSRDKLLNIPVVATTIAGAYHEALKGGPRKN